MKKNETKEQKPERRKGRERETITTAREGCNHDDEGERDDDARPGVH